MKQLYYLQYSLFWGFDVYIHMSIQTLNISVIKSQECPIVLQQANPLPEVIRIVLPMVLLCLNLIQ